MKLEGTGEARRKKRMMTIDGVWVMRKRHIRGGRNSYRKHKWMFVAAWSNIDLEEAYRRAAEIMIVLEIYHSISGGGQAKGR